MNVLYVVGLGPGGSRWMTWEARAALEQAEVLCGYTVYLDLIRGEFPDKEYFSTPMTQEIERCRAALERPGPAGPPPWCAAETRGCTAWRGRCWSWPPSSRRWRSRWCPV